MRIEGETNFQIKFNWNNKVAPLHVQENNLVAKSQKNSPALDKNHFFNGLLQDLRHSAGELKNNNREMCIKTLIISEFNPRELDEENEKLVKMVQTDENLSKICRICLDANDPETLISPCACKGFQKFVHQNCLKTWIMRNNFFDVQLTMCEICKDSFLLQFEHSRYCSPFTENSCRVWLFFLVSCIMFSFIACFILEDYIDTSTRGLIIFSVCLIFGLIGLASLVLTLTSLKSNCTSQRISIWRILSKSYPPQ